jgi:signal transduction histidine kinase
MKKFQSIRLLSKTTLYYLGFTFLAFFLSAVILTKEAEQFINDELEQRFNHTERRIRRQLKTGQYPERIPASAVLSQVTYNSDLNETPVYSDTLIFNSDTEEMQLFRKKTIFLNEANVYYKLSITKSLEDFYRLKNDIFGALIPVFVILAIAIILFNSLLSGSVFKPFNRILSQMRTYQVGAEDRIKIVRTTTTEFRKMQHLFHEMVDRIEKDYRNLKEYTENMAHEIQTPLTIIRNKTENLIADEALMEKHASTVKMIYDETNHISKLGNTLNLLTKIENQEFHDAERILTGPVIEKHLESISEVANLKSLKLEKDLSERHFLVIDPFLFDILIKNLLRNALRYGSEEGPIRIKTTARSMSISNYGAQLENGSERLFERFFRENGSQSSQGLGLSLVKKICELNNLIISYTYEDNQHIFTITTNNQDLS